MIGSDAWGADVRHLDAAGCPVRHSSSGPPPKRGPPTRPILALSTRPGGAGVGRPVWQAWTVQHARVAALAGRLLR